MYNDKVVICKLEIIPPVNYYTIPVDLFQMNYHVINFTTDDMISKFEVFPKKNGIYYI